ncbi:MAG: 3-hydroxyacyl-ACP dehydratase FabZ family protein [Candidatus Eiseniibacteriota bacterium]
MRHLYVDRVLVLERFASIVVVSSLDAEDELFRYHFPARPVVPASLLVEVFAQVATVLLEASIGYARKAIPVLVNGAKFRHAVIPGTGMEVVMNVSQHSEDGAVLGGRIEQAGRVCSTIELGMALEPLERFFTPADRELYHAMHAGWLRGARIEGFDRHPLEDLNFVGRQS